jgi:alpha-galactosidase/6-phospho-beta-glucosidase family protein
LRNVPVFVKVARKMEQLCPDAWLIHVTNPLSQLTRAVRVDHEDPLCRAVPQLRRHDQHAGRLLRRK